MSKVKICGIYKITNPNGFVYIGKSQDIISRISSYRNPKCYQQPLLYSSLIDFGFWNHKVEIIKECDNKSLSEWELFYIKKYDKKSLNIASCDTNKGAKFTVTIKIN